MYFMLFLFAAAPAYYQSPTLPTQDATDFSCVRQKNKIIANFHANEVPTHLRIKGPTDSYIELDTKQLKAMRHGRDDEIAIDIKTTTTSNRPLFPIKGRYDLVFFDPIRIANEQKYSLSCSMRIDD